MSRPLRGIAFKNHSTQVAAGQGNKGKRKNTPVIESIANLHWKSLNKLEVLQYSLEKKSIYGESVLECTVFFHFPCWLNPAWPVRVLLRLSCKETKRAPLRPNIVARPYLTGDSRSNLAGWTKRRSTYLLKQNQNDLVKLSAWRHQNFNILKVRLTFLEFLCGWHLKRN